MTVITSRQPLVILSALSVIPNLANAGPAVRVGSEEAVCTYAPADNGAGPLWCYGAPLVVRQGEEVFVSIIETGTDVPPLCNTRWQLWRRRGGSWSVVAEEESYRQREPCPLVRLGDGALYLSANPSTELPGVHYGPCRPTVFRFSQEDGSFLRRREVPAFKGGPHFTDHSYRGFASDVARGEVLLLNIDASTSAQHVAHRDAAGKWHDRGKIVFPIRAAYPQVALRNGAAHVLAIGDIVEPVEEWRKLKREVTQREWDYVFRRLFYAWTPDLGRESFHPPIEVASVERTGGHIQNLDLYVDSNGVAHLLFLERPHQHEFLRDRYFPGEPMTRHLRYVRVRDGKVVSRSTITETPLEGDGIAPAYARFHVTPDDSLHVVVSGTRIERVEGEERRRRGNFVVTIGTEAVDARLDFEFEEIPLEHPFGTFFTSVPRGGARPSWTLDLFGLADQPRTLRYAEVLLRGGVASGRTEAR